MTLGVGGGLERLTKIIYPTFTKEFRYDAEGRVSEEIYVLDGGGSYSVSYSYDQFGRLQSTTGPDGTTSTTHYDLLGRKIAVTGETGHVAFEYDNWDNLTSLSDAKGQITEFVYDNSGRLTQELRPMQQSTGYEYDDQGRLQKILDAKNQTTDYGYDSQGRIETISYDDGRSVTLSYGTNGNLAGYDDGVTSASYTYDAVGRKLSETINYGVFTKSFSYTYYSNGLKKSFTAPDGTVYEYAYGSNNELREVRIPGLGSITISEYQWNRPKTMLYPGGSKREYEYDPLMRLTRLVATDPGGNILFDSSYEYDSTGNIVSKTTEHGTYTYGYDSASRLTSVDNPTLDDESYSYDAVGNRTSASNADGTISHNANNELTVYGDVEYTYDANGNMIQKKLGDVAVNYVYNAENRLVKVEDDLTKTVIVEYSYDPFGRRLWKEVSGVRTYFFYSDEGLIGEYDASGTEIRTYGYKPNSTWMTDPLWLKQGTEYYFYQNDHLGTPQKLTAVNGAVVWSATYSAFGQAYVAIETVTNHLRLPGQYFDGETGLHYNGHRYYDSQIGRYIQTDPIGLEGGINVFTYGINDPVKNLDPLGLWVHPHQIVPPEEAFQVINNAAGLIEAYSGFSPDGFVDNLLLLENTELYAYEYEYVYGSSSGLQKHIISFIKRSNDPVVLLLAYLARYNHPGGIRKEGNPVSGYHNRFVFTCQNGWIDMGHFFEAATMGYWLEKGIIDPLEWRYDDLELIELGEKRQNKKRTSDYEKGWQHYLLNDGEWLPGWKPSPSAESAFTAEDIPSNLQGMQFGRDLARNTASSLHTVVTVWQYFLRTSHAIDYQRGSEVHDRLQEDARNWWFTYDDSGMPPEEEDRDMIYIGPRSPWTQPGVKCQSEAFRTLCCCSASEAECLYNCYYGECQITEPIY